MSAEYLKVNDPKISATKATKESADTAAPLLVGVAAVWLSGKIGEDISPEALAGALAAGTVFYKWISKFIRDYMKKRPA